MQGDSRNYRFIWHWAPRKATSREKHHVRIQFHRVPGRGLPAKSLLLSRPTATNAHRPVPHHEIVQTLTETPGFRLIGVDDGALWRDGMKMFGGLDLNEI